MPNNHSALKDRMLAVIADVNAQVAEREELVEMIAYWSWHMMCWSSSPFSGS